jgi:hypothetical protein
LLHVLKKHGLLATRSNNALLTLRKVRGRLFALTPRPCIVARGWEDWAGWVELKTEQLADAAIANTARVVAEVNADVLVLVEVESRPAVQHFHDKVLAPEPHQILDGCDHLVVVPGLGDVVARRPEPDARRSRAIGTQSSSRLVGTSGGAPPNAKSRPAKDRLALVIASD